MWLTAISTPYHTCKTGRRFKKKTLYFVQFAFFYFSLFFCFLVPILVSLSLLLTPIFLVIDSIELYIKSQLGFVYFFWLKKGKGFLSIHYILYLEFITGFIIRWDDPRSCHLQLGIKIAFIVLALIQLSKVFDRRYFTRSFRYMHSNNGVVFSNCKI